MPYLQICSFVNLYSLLAVIPSITLQEHQGSDKTWVWHAPDFADGEVKEELFCIRFGSVESRYLTDVVFYV